MAIAKRPAAANATQPCKRPATEAPPAADEEQVVEMEAEDDVQPEPEVEDPAAQAATEEAETVKARRRELKGMYANALNDLISQLGLTAGKKEEMVEAIVQQEAAERAAKREQAATLRRVVVEKKQELEALPIAELRQLCNSAGIKGMITKQERVEQLLKAWQDDDGVDRAVAKAARDARERQLEMADKPALLKACEKAGVEPYVKEVLLDRLVRREVLAGHFKRPELPAEEAEVPQAKPVDLVEALLASETTRKKEKELKKQQEEAMHAKIRELKSKTNDELKEMITKRGCEASGKKEELLEQIVELLAQEEKTEARRAKLKAGNIEEVKALLSARGLPTSGKKEELVEVLMSYEAKQRDCLRAWAGKVEKVLEAKKAELEGQTGNQLKDLCVAQGLKAGLSKEERVARLLEAARSSGEADSRVATGAAEERRQELSALSTATLAELCRENGLDPLVKEVMVERLLEA